jgi:hypothetical protein
MSTRWTRGAVALALLAGVAVSPGGCGGSNGAADGGGAGTGSAGDGGGAGTDGGGGTDAGAPDGPQDQATDFGEPMTSDVAINCPTGGGPLAPAAAAVLIDDFSGVGLLDGRSRVGAGFEIKEQFDATANALFDPEPGVEPKCGAAAAGAAHFRGKAADTGATFTVVFSSAGDGGKASNHYDASATKGITFRVALGDPKAVKVLTVQVNLADSQWDYTKDVIVDGTAWQNVTIAWADLQAAPAAPTFSAAALNQIVFPFSAGDDVDFYVDDLAFAP